MPETKTRRRRKPPGGMQSLVQGAAVDAVRFLHDTVLNPEEKLESRIKCATVLLDHGKKTECVPNEPVEVVLGECEELAK